MLTSRQHDLLTVIERHIGEKGFSPSYDEMARALGLRSKSGIHRLVAALEGRGFITRQKGLARSIDVIRSASVPSNLIGVALFGVPYRLADEIRAYARQKRVAEDTIVAEAVAAYLGLQ